MVAAQSLTSVKVELDELFEEFMDDEDNEDEHAVNEAFQVHLARTMDIVVLRGVWHSSTKRGTDDAVQDTQEHIHTAGGWGRPHV